MASCFSLAHQLRYDANYLTLYRARRNGDYSVSKVSSTGGSDNDRKISVLLATMATPSGHPVLPLFVSLSSSFFFPYRWRRPHAPSLSSVVNGGGRDGRIITEPSRLCAEWHIGIHTVHAYTDEVEVFRAGIMASTHLRSISAYRVRPQERSFASFNEQQRGQRFS